jgi:hypothetical protein
VRQSRPALTVARVRSVPQRSPDGPGGVWMLLAERPELYATMHVTRVENWWIEAESAEEAQELLNSGHGERAHIGECIHCEVASIEE